MSGDAGEETVIRRVRGILNKITPETFDTLSRQLLDVGIDNERVLQDIILVLFEKALKEPHFSSLYAEVCLVLSKHGPNFEHPDLRGRTETTSFLKLLLSNCQREFDNRVQLCATLAEGKKDGFTPEEEIEFHAARQKMLGNIKFVGELGKLDLVSEKILHSCIQQLLTRLRNPFPEDLECLCGLLATTGRRLDHERAKSYMDTYFARVGEIMQQPLPSRIRFMLQDTIELRKNKWVPRMAKEGPKKMQDIRNDVKRDKGGRGGKDSHPAAAAADARGRAKPAQTPELLDAALRSLANISRPVVGEVSLRPVVNLRAPSGRGPGSPDMSSGRVRTPNARRKQMLAELPLEQVLSRADGIFQDFFLAGDETDAVESLSELRCAPHSAAVLDKFIFALLDAKEPSFAKVLSFLQALFDKKVVEADKLVVALSGILRTLGELVIDYPRAPPRLAELVAELACEGLVPLNSLTRPDAAVIDARFLAKILVELKSTLSDDKLVELCRETNVDILRLPPAVSLSAAEQHEFLQEFGLEFLNPQVKVKQNLRSLFAEHVTSSATTTKTTAITLLRLIKEKLPAAAVEDMEFPRTLQTVLLERVCELTSLRTGAEHAATKDELKEEKALLLVLLPLVAKYADSTPKQVGVIYAAQAFCFTNRFPKGLVLRIAMALYDEDVVEQAAWMHWREEINDHEPGKGDALVDLNEYLNWMETAEDEDDE